MKTLALFVTILIAPFALAQCLAPQDNRITVKGSVELKEVADQATTAFTIKGIGPSLRLAVQDASEKTQSLVAKLLALGLKSQNVSTSSFYAGENMGDKKFLSSSRDYQATLSTSLKIDSLPLLQPILITLSEADVQTLSDIRFSLKDELVVRRKVRTQAALKAKEKADDICKALGVTVGRVLNVEETQPTQSASGTSVYRGGRSFPNSFNSVVSYEVPPVDESRGTGFFAQTITLSSQVTVTFEIK